jgi:hypothetical protein
MTEGKIVKKVVTDELGVRVTEHVAVVKSQGERVTGFAESEREGLSSASGVRADGSIDMRLEGDPPQGENDTLATACVFRTNVTTDSVRT